MKFPISFNKNTGAFLTMCWILWETKGMFHSGIPVGLFVLTILVVYRMVYLFRDAGKTEVKKLTAQSTVLFLLGVQGLMLLLGLFVADYDLLHFDMHSRYKYVLQVSIVVFDVGLIYLFYQARTKRDIFVSLVGLVCIALIIQSLVVFCSAVAGIDVVVMMQNACNHFVHFQNPYDYRYADIYHGITDRHNGLDQCMTYWPSCVYFSALPYYFFGDYRYTYVLVSIVVALVMYRYRAMAGLSKEGALGIILLWLSSPVLMFVINRGWIDTFATLPFFMALYFLWKQKPVLSGIALGFVLSIKIYYFFLAPVLLIYIFDHWGWKKALYFVFASAGIFVACLAPFLIINAEQLYNCTVVFYSSWNKASPESLSIVSYVSRFGLEWMRQGYIFGLIAMTLLYIRFWMGAITIPRLLHCAAGVLLIFFIAAQSYCNYYYFVLFLFFLSIYFEEIKETSPAANDDVTQK